ncbi:MAG: DUF1801 domain-containing protein [Flammeovirgaceae bacterium]|jgi:hypothetical protein|nr:DUF1801 domain-containing protein [Flammeovirgaceae bacterium]
MVPETNKSVDDIIAELPGPEKIIVKKLRAIILDCLPNAQEKNSDGVHFYRRNRMICYIWPPSVRWDSKMEKHNDEVVLGFSQGNLMAKNKVLLAEGRKQVYCMYFKSVKEIDEAQIQALLFEAGIIDEEFARKKKP